MPFVNSNGVKIHYEVEGKGPALIMQHGFAATCWTWRDFNYAQELGESCFRHNKRGPLLRKTAMKKGTT